MRRRVVPEFDDERMPLECRLDVAPLHAAPAAVNQPHFGQTGFHRGIDVFLDDPRDVLRRESLQVDLAFDRNPIGHQLTTRVYGFLYSAVTTVLIPPRTEKSPTTVMRRGARAATRSSRI